jgi:hypothetical protein
MMRWVDSGLATRSVRLVEWVSNARTLNIEGNRRQEHGTGIAIASERHGENAVLMRRDRVL